MIKPQRARQAGQPRSSHLSRSSLAAALAAASRHLRRSYVCQSQEQYQAQVKEKQIKALRRKARQLGLEVIEKTSVSGTPAAAEPEQG